MVAIVVEFLFFAMGFDFGMGIDCGGGSFFGGNFGGEELEFVAEFW